MKFRTQGELRDWICKATHVRHTDDGIVFMQEQPDGTFNEVEVSRREYYTLFPDDNAAEKLINPD